MVKPFILSVQNYKLIESFCVNLVALDQFSSEEITAIAIAFSTDYFTIKKLFWLDLGTISQVNNQEKPITPCVNKVIRSNLPAKNSVVWIDGKKDQITELKSLDFCYGNDSSVNANWNAGDWPIVYSANCLNEFTVS